MNTRELYDELLAQYISFKSVSTDPAHKTDIQITANWLQELFLKRGFTAEIIEGYGNPIVAARFNAGEKETCLIYGHYDVQPAIQEEGWFADPFEVHEREGRLYARGVVDNKGQLLIHIATIFDLIQKKELGYNITFLIEGDEETSAGNIGACIAEHQELFKADFALVSDGTLMQGIPSIDLGFRGGANATITVRTSHTDLHSGLYGGAVPNAALVLNRFLASLHDENNMVTIPGFYDDVDAVDEETLEKHAAIPFDEQEHARQTGTKCLDCEPGFDFYTQTGLRPSIEITSVESGYIGEGYRNAIPSWARAKLNFRFVASQKGQEILDAFKAYARAQIPPYADIEIEHTVAWGGVKLSIENGYIGKAKEILEEIYNKDVLFLYCGGSIPVIFDIQDILNIPQVLVPLGNEDSNMHGVNENYEIDQLEKSLQFSNRFFTA